MAEFSIDRFVDRYAARAAGMTASEVRALFAVAARPEVVSLAGGMPFVQALPNDQVASVARTVLEEHGDVALQYGGGQGSVGLRERLVMLMAEEDIQADLEDVVVTAGAQQALDLIGKLFIDPGDVVALEAPAYVGALTAFGVYQPRFLPIEIDEDGMIVEQLEQALLRGERPTFVYTVPNFGNPAGVTMSAERRARRDIPVAARRDARRARGASRRRGDVDAPQRWVRCVGDGAGLARHEGVARGRGRAAGRVRARHRVLSGRTRRAPDAPRVLLSNRSAHPRGRREARLAPTRRNRPLRKPARLIDA